MLIAADVDPQVHRNGQRRILEAAHLNTLELVASKWLSLKQPQISRSSSRKSLALYFCSLGLLDIDNKAYWDKAGNGLYEIVGYKP